ncbi:MAG TPA: UDP-N-acetylmuramate dehydrogenase [Candidatus Limnocylindria bacterium]|jgi:UDP-N-acetylmuramate dehydrogenase|nr:UDP-N-acetylmuramate dehydrogenase [Candidatus Limnocylindria bacterium]
MTEDLQRLDALAAERGIALDADVPLGPFTTLRVGGPADRLVTPRTRDELLGALALARDAGATPFVLGNGSDLVIADAGVRGLVIRNRARGLVIDGDIVTADSGTPMAMLVKRCTREGLTGIEFGISIPGSLGGAVWANAGAHGGEMRDVLRTVEVADGAELRTLDSSACGFDYRESRFKHSGEVVLGASLVLARGAPEEIAARVDAHQAQRRATQPLAEQNAGSVFRNPPGDHAGRLIEAAGLKGHRLGGAHVSTLHANFMLTDAGASAADVRALGDHVRAVVAERSGVELQYEIEFVGDWTPAGVAA